MGRGEPCADTNGYFLCEGGYCDGTGKVSLREAVHKNHADSGTREKRSWNMSRIRGKDTEIVIKVRSLSEGFLRAGFDPVAHIEMDMAACYTLKTRMAYKWLREQGHPEIYNRYLSNQNNALSVLQNAIVSCI